MRADRLLSILLILQRQGRATAKQLASDLEVSERTIYRDIDALSMAGVPVYGEPGPDGGYALLDNFRTYLTGLTGLEMQALFMLAIPQPLSELGASQSLKSALLKIFSSLPSGGQQTEEWVRQRFLLDTTPSVHRSEPSHHLQTIQQAVWQDQMVALRYRIGPLAHDVEQEVMPLSLVAKAGVWHLVYAIHNHPRAIGVAALTGVRLLNASFERPETFELSSFWEAWCLDHEDEPLAYRVTVRADSATLDQLERWRVVDPAIKPTKPNSRLTIDLAFGSLEEARKQILGMGGAVEVLNPIALRASIVDYARQIVNVYGEKVVAG